MLSKTQLIQEIDKFPEEFSVEFITERIRALERKAKEKTPGKTEAGSHYKPDTSIDKWFK